MMLPIGRVLIPQLLIHRLLIHRLVKTMDELDWANAKSSLIARLAVLPTIDKSIGYDERQSRQQIFAAKNPLPNRMTAN